MMKRLHHAVTVLALVALSLPARAQGVPGVKAQTDPEITIEVLSCRDSVLHPRSPGCEGIKYGFEGGRVVKVGDTYHLFTSEMVGDPIWVKMKLGHWSSKDGVSWKRIGTLRESDGDTTGASQYAAPWAPMVVFVAEDNRWHVVYVNYRSKVTLRNYAGVIQHAVSETPGLGGIDGPYRDTNELLRYDVDPDPWEGAQGTDSFFPFKVKETWYGFYGSATIENWGKGCKWNIGLASAPRIEGPWKRMSALNPTDSTHFAENPIVLQLENGIYIAIVDGGPWVNHTGYLLSRDGLHWTKVRHIDIEPKVKRWWGDMRTPLSLIKEDDGTYTMFFTAYRDGNPKFGMLSKLTLRLTLAD
jgi:hypothetical protein